jgi:hypothetical protein
MKPPQSGPSTGPNRGPAEKKAIANPRCSFSNRSATTPPPIVKQAEPPMPVTSRKTISADMLGARAQPTWKSTKIEVAMFRINLRPNISLSGEKNKGPTYESSDNVKVCGQILTA